MQLCNIWIFVSYYESSTCTGMQYCHHANTILQISLGKVRNLFLKLIKDIIRTKVIKCKIIKCLHNDFVHGVISKAMNGSTQWHFMICVVLIYFISFKNRWCIAPVITFSKIFSQWWNGIPKHVVVFMHYMVVFDWDICIHETYQHIIPTHP